MSATLTVYSIASCPSCAIAAGAVRTFTQQARHEIRVRAPTIGVYLKRTVRMSVLLPGSLAAILRRGQAANRVVRGTDRIDPSFEASPRGVSLSLVTVAWFAQIDSLIFFSRRTTRWIGAARSGG